MSYLNPDRQGQRTALTTQHFALHRPGHGCAVAAKHQPWRSVPIRILTRLADGMAWSGGLAALAALLLTGAASVGMGVQPAAPLLALAAAGAYIVYAVDLLRGLPRDRLTSPLRSAFVERRRTTLRLLLLPAFLICVGAALCVGVRVTLAALPVAGAGFFHRRLKRFDWAKPLYLGAAWTVVTVGLPALHDPVARGAWVPALVIGCSVSANVLLSSLRDGEGVAARLDRKNTLRAAGALLVPAGLAPVLLPAAPLALLCIPAAMCVAILAFRPGERAGGIGADGALVAGGALAWILAGLPGAG